jgi:hypothetical protein
MDAGEQPSSLADTSVPSVLNKRMYVSPDDCEHNENVYVHPSFRIAEQIEYADVALFEEPA